MLPIHPTDTTPLFHSLFEEKKLEVAILRLDQIHCEISGNKFFKLKYNLEEAKKQGKPAVLTFGGAYSNHIYATASAAREAGLASIGIIRGDGMDSNNPTLIHAREQGMRLHFVSREDYRKKNSKAYIDQLLSQFGDVYLIPEGGTNALAIKGTADILQKKHQDYTHICTSIGTGGTFAGLAKSLLTHQNLLGFSSLKGEFMRAEIRNLLHESGITSKGKWEVLSQYHFGGYAKWTDELIDFIHWFWSEFRIPLDPIYTGKMAYAFFDLVRKNHFPESARILLIHTGGLQGNAGFTKRTGIQLPTP